MEIFEKELELLLINSSFEELLDKEKSYVLQYLSKEEYDSYHLLLNRSMNSFSMNDKVIQPDHTIEKNLRNAFRAKYKKSFFNFEFYFFRFPELSVSLVLFFFVIGYCLISTRSGETITIIKPPKNQIDSKTPVVLQSYNHAIDKKELLKDPARINKRKISSTLRPNKIRKSEVVALNPSHVILISTSDILSLNTDEEEPLCLYTSIEPLGLDLEIKDSMTPGLTVNSEGYP